MHPAKKILGLFAVGMAMVFAYWVFQSGSPAPVPQPIASAPLPTPPAFVSAPPLRSAAPPIPAPTAPQVNPAPAANVMSEPVTLQPAPPPPEMNDLGTVEFTDGEPLMVNLALGKTCTITPKVLADGTLQLSMVIEGPGDGIGATETLSSPTIITRPGQSVAVSVNDLGLSLTPVLKDQ